MRRRTVMGALFLIGIGVVLGATVFRTDIARATGLARAAAPVNIVSPLDAQGNVNVHEQGTANVNVTNDAGHGVPVTGLLSARPLAPVAPWSFSSELPVGGITVLAGPSSSAIDLTSLSVGLRSVPSGEGPGLALAEGLAPASSSSPGDCQATGDPIWSLTQLTPNLVVPFPTPLQIPPNRVDKVCLMAEGLGHEGPILDVNASGFYG